MIKNGKIVSITWGPDIEYMNDFVMQNKIQRTNWFLLPPTLYQYGTIILCIVM